MATFVYRGKNRLGETVVGEIEAENPKATVTRLREKDIFIISIKPKPKPIEIKFKIGKGITMKEIAVFTRQFSTMINAGLPLIQCLEILASQMDNKRFQAVIDDIRRNVEAGSTLAAALSKHPKIYDSLYVHMVEAGEAGGILDTILMRLANYMEKAEALKRKIKSAMLYPATVSVIALLVTVGLITFIVPVFAQMFEGLGAKMPTPTRILLNLSTLSRRYLPFVAGGIAILGVSFTRFRKTAGGSKAIDSLFLKLPVIGILLRKVAVAKFTRTLGTLISSGVPILDALDITSKTAGNKVIEEAVINTRENIREGKNIADPLKATGVFPPMVVQMISVGEQTGALDEMLGKIADFYDEEVDTAVAGLTSLIEPLLMAFLGVVVGSIIIALFLPIITMTQLIK